MKRNVFKHTKKTVEVYNKLLKSYLAIQSDSDLEREGLTYDDYKSGDFGFNLDRLRYDGYCSTDNERMAAWYKKYGCIVEQEKGWFAVKLDHDYDHFHDLAQEFAEAYDALARKVMPNYFDIIAKDEAIEVTRNYVEQGNLSFFAAALNELKDNSPEHVDEAEKLLSILKTFPLYPKCDHALEYTSDYHNAKWVLYVTHYGEGNLAIKVCSLEDGMYPLESDIITINLSRWYEDYEITLSNDYSNSAAFMKKHKLGKPLGCTRQNMGTYALFELERKRLYEICPHDMLAYDREFNEEYEKIFNEVCKAVVFDRDDLKPADKKGLVFVGNVAFQDKVFRVFLSTESEESFEDQLMHQIADTLWLEQIL